MEGLGISACDEVSRTAAARECRHAWAIMQHQCMHLTHSEGQLLQVILTLQISRNAFLRFGILADCTLARFVLQALQCENDTLNVLDASAVNSSYHVHM